MAKIVKANSFVKNLSRLPNKPDFDKHFWVDYIELICLFSKEQLLTQSDFLENYKHRSSDLAEGAAIFKSKAQNEDTPENNDRQKVFVQECYSLIEVRKQILKEYYPFSLSADKTYVSVIKTLTNSHKLYIFLLYCSSLSYFRNETEKMTSSFELFCFQILKNIFPRYFEVHYFGSRNKYIRPRRYTGNKFDKFAKLNSDFNEPLKNLLLNKEDIPKNDVGDGGIDFVGWLPNGDGLPHLFTFLGQAGCTDDWDVKQTSSSEEKLKNHIHFSVTPTNFVFVPFCIRNSSAQWHKPHDIANCILFDRMRLLYHFEDKYSVFKKLPSYSFVNDSLNPQTRIL